MKFSRWWTNTLCGRAFSIIILEIPCFLTSQVLVMNVISLRGSQTFPKMKTSQAGVNLVRLSLCQLWLQFTMCSRIIQRKWIHKAFHYGYNAFTAQANLIWLWLLTLPEPIFTMREMNFVWPKHLTPIEQRSVCVTVELHIEPNILRHLVMPEELSLSFHSWTALLSWSCQKPSLRVTIFSHFFRTFELNQISSQPKPFLVFLPLEMGKKLKIFDLRPAVVPPTSALQDASVWLFIICVGWVYLLLWLFNVDT